MNLDLMLKKLNNKAMMFDLVRKRRFKNKVLLMSHKELLTNLEKAKQFFLLTKKESQKENIKLLEKIVTSCISIYNDKETTWQFKFEIKALRDQEEFHPYFLENELRHDIKEATLNIAGGLIDMAAFGLRVGVHSFDPEVEPILFLDEPFKNLGNKISEGGEVAQELSKELNLQIVIITHDQNLRKIANKLIVIGEDYGE